MDGLAPDDGPLIALLLSFYSDMYTHIFPTSPRCEQMHSQMLSLSEKHTLTEREREAPELRV